MTQRKIVDWESYENGFASGEAAGMQLGFIAGLMTASVGCILGSWLLDLL